MSNNHNDTHHKKRGIKEYTLDKEYKVWIRDHSTLTDHLIISYDDKLLANYCVEILDSNGLMNPGLDCIESWIA